MSIYKIILEVCKLATLISLGIHFLSSGCWSEIDVLQLLQVAIDVADALDYLHPAVVHRDLKSQNGMH